MLSKIYTFIYFPFSVIYLLFGILVAIDHYLPQVTLETRIQNKIYDHAPRINRKSSGSGTDETFYLVLNQERIVVEEDLFHFATKKDTCYLSKTKILKRPMALSFLKSNYLYKFQITYNPFTYFPLFPIIFSLPFIFSFYKKENISLMALKHLSWFLAFFELIMSFI